MTSPATVTISIASPAVVTWTAHGFSAGQAVWFGFQWPLGTLPAGITPGILYYVLATGLTTNTFEFALTAGGTAIVTTAAGSGIITGNATSSVLNTFVPPVDPSPGTKNKPEIKLKQADFGDGYTQVTRFGLNWIRQVATVQWDVLLPDQAKAIENFFVGQGGDTPFWYALRGDTIRKWTCKDYDRTRSEVGKMSATLREDFGPLS